MKKVKEILYEKFESESDPIKDMNIGGINFFDEYIERYKQQENRLFAQWQEFVIQTIKGKWIEGVMDKYVSAHYTPQRVHIKIPVREVLMDKNGLINIRTDFADYHLLPNERYKITDK